MSLPTLAEFLDRCHFVTLPLRVRFRGVREREAVVFEGPHGWGEFSPFLEYDSAECLPWLKCGLEMAFAGPPPQIRDRVEVNATVPAIKPWQIDEVLTHFPGCRTIKVKVAEKDQTLKDDQARIDAIRAYLPGAIIRVDANGGWTVPEALCAAEKLGPIDYMEQPCATIEELAELRQQLIARNLHVKVAADESIRKATDPVMVAKRGAADVAVVKAAPLGGPQTVLEVANFMRSKGLDITVSSALETGVGMNAGLAAVAALPGGSAPAGLATQRLFVADITAQRPLIDGFLSTAPLAPEPDRLADFASPVGRKDFWVDRIKQTWELL